MFSKRIVMTCLAGALAFSPASKVLADGGDIVGGIIGGVIGGVIVNSATNNQRRTTTTQTTRNTSVSSATRAANRETQTSLNYFGFPAGTPDGQLGRRSRGAISQYQVFMGYPATGQLTHYERDFLVSSYHRAISGGYETTQIVASNPYGPKGLLYTYRDQANGSYNQPLPQSAGKTVNGYDPEGADENTLASTSKDVPEITAITEGSTDTEQTAMASLPNFMADSGNQRSLASHCNQVSLLTNSNGGFVTEASMSDPNFALNEQFCLARTYAIAQGEDLASRVQGATNAQIEAQCEAFGPAMKDYVAALSLKPHDQVMQDVSGFILSTGMSPAQLSGTAKICLSVGYRTDNLDVALSSALLLTVLGEQVYGELMGHHLSQGFGTSTRPDLALAWYQIGFDASDNGATAVFAPGNPDRNALIRRAAYQANGQDDQAALGETETVQPVTTLPTFSLNP